MRPVHWFKAKVQRFSFTLGLLLFLSVVVMATVAALTYRDHLRWVAHTHIVIDKIQDIVSEFERAESRNSMAVVARGKTQMNRS